MAASTEIVIGDSESQQLVIRALSRRPPGLFDHSDGNWIESEIHIVAGGFQADFRANLRSDEFQMFFEQLEGVRRTFHGAATFATVEGQLALALSADEEGGLRVGGEASDVGSSGSRLQFSFAIDRASLPAICQSLESVLAAFPVVSSPGT